VPILDYSKLLADRPELFTDPEHLTDDGATILSARAADDISRLIGLPAREDWACNSKEPQRAYPLIPVLRGLLFQATH
jgi:hypothetical protein